MSTFQAPSGTFGAPEQPKPKSGSNIAGIFGFVLAILSLVLCCLPYANVALSVLAIVLCVIGLFHVKKGLSIAGIVIAVLTLILGVLWSLGFSNMMSAIKPMGFVGGFKAFGTVVAVEEHANKNSGTLPADLATTGGDPEMFKDTWGNEFEYTARGDNTFTLVSAGPDGRLGTSDDIDIGKGMRDRGMGSNFPRLRTLKDAPETPQQPLSPGATEEPKKDEGSGEGGASNPVDSGKP